MANDSLNLFSFENAGMRILVLGATGLLGNAVFRVFSEKREFAVLGTMRDRRARSFFAQELHDNLIAVDNIEELYKLIKLISIVRPNVVVNCISLHRKFWHDSKKMISIFSLLPHRLSHICRQIGARFIQISSDGVFSGSSGYYTEDDIPDATDFYGVAKLLGEIQAPGSITLRTSIIGHEIESKFGLLEWFLGQSTECKGNTRAIFSGFPAVVLAQIIRDVVLPNADLHGIYHVASPPISKYDLLLMLAHKYCSSTRIVPDDTVVMDRSLCADRFKSATGYESPEWPLLIDIMYSYKFGLKA